MFDGLRRWSGRRPVQDRANSPLPPSHWDAGQKEQHEKKQQEKEQEKEQQERRLENLLLTDILVRIPRLAMPDGRQDLLRQAGCRLSEDTPHSSVARDHLRFIVEAARRTDGALKALRDALSDIELDDIDREWFDLVVTVLTADGPLPRSDMVALVCELRGCTREFGGRAVDGYLSRRRNARRPLGDGSPTLALPTVLRELFDARRDDAHPGRPRDDLLRFLQLLLAEAEGSEAQGEQGEQGEQDDLVEVLGRILASAPDPGPEPDSRARAGVGTRRQVIIQIRVEEEEAPSDLPYHRRHYSLRGFYYERTGDDRPVFQGSRAAPGLFTGDELDRCGREFVASWPEPWDEAVNVSKRVEFLLPHSLLGHPAEGWPSLSGMALGHTCQVVVRSLPRYRDSALHDDWIRRWEALDRDRPRGDALKRIGWMGPGAGTESSGGENSPAPPPSWPAGTYPPLRLTDLADIEDWLLMNPDLACLGLVAPYGDQHPLLREAVCEALLAYGIPAMVWRRDTGDPGPLLDALREAEPPALLADLPHSVHQARRRNRLDETDVRRRISLLWDDPKCVHRDQDHQMSGTHGAGEGAP